jgi:hypothetical protein
MEQASKSLPRMKLQDYNFSAQQYKSTQLGNFFSKIS